MIRVGYFCTSGYTEAGGIHQFLQRLRPDIEWHRCFPAFDKPGPKLRKVPVEQSGTTGQSLIDLMLERLQKYYHQQDRPFTLVLLIDDADCRLLDPANALINRLSTLTQEVQEKTGEPHVQFLALLASPEIESWFLADWEEGFGKEYPQLAHGLRQLLQEKHYLGPAPWNDLEDYGGPYNAQAHCCTNKLSEKVISCALGELAMKTAKQHSPTSNDEYDPTLFRYSKKVQGPAMLRRVRAEKIAGVCKHFRSSYQMILAVQPTPVPETPQTPTTTSEAPKTAGRRKRLT